MEEQLEDKLSDFNSSISVEDSTVFWNITRWSRFIALAGLLLILFLALCILAAYAQESSGVRYRLLAGNGSSLMILVSGGLISLVQLIFLFRFALFTRRGITNTDQGWFNEGINALKLYFIINGIGGVIYCLLMFVGVISKSN